LHETPSQPKHSAGFADSARVRTADLDAVLASVPQDAVAARVLSQHGEHYEPVVNYASHWHSENPPPLRSPRGLSPEARRLIGLRFGRFTVLGLADFRERGKNAQAAWAVRCACGHYETRNAKAMRNTEEPLNNMCRNCQHVEIAKRRYADEGGRPFTDFGFSSVPASPPGRARAAGKP
jgi:hypothetical protein